MSRRTDLEKWIASANALVVDLTSEGGKDNVKVPLLGVAKGDPEGLYTTYAPTITVPNAGNMYSRGNKFRFPGVKVSASVPGDAWNTLTNTQLALVLSAKLGEVKAPEVKAPEVKAPEVKTPEVKASEVKAPEVKTPEVKTPEVKTPEVKAPEDKSPKKATAKKAK